MAVHILIFLSKHHEEQFTSTEIAESVCVNPVQLRRVLSILNQQELIYSKKGKSGGYAAIESCEDIVLGDLYRLFASSQPASKVYTGSKENDCLISQNIETIMSAHQEALYLKNAQYFDQFTVKDIKNEILIGAY